MSTVALIPYFGGTGPKAPSPVMKRPEYLRRTVKSLQGFADIIWVGVCRSEDEHQAGMSGDVIAARLEDHELPPVLCRASFGVRLPLQAGGRVGCQRQENEMCENPEPRPVDEKPAPEIRGGNRTEDYSPPWYAYPVAHEDFELEDGAESYGGNDPDEPPLGRNGDGT
jgi:hypothetical protein